MNQTEQLTMKFKLHLTSKRLWLAIALAGMAVIALGLAVSGAAAQNGSPLHPTFPLLDANGANVLESGAPLSTVTTCGACHDTQFITAHNAHEGILSGALTAPAGEPVLVDGTTGTLTVLDEAAADVEMNCFLCHGTTSNNEARLAALLAGDDEWVNTATLVGTGVVLQSGSAYTWNPDAFNADGHLLPDYVGTQEPAVENCAQCHGYASTEARDPLVMDACDTTQRMTVTTGQVFSPQRISDSGLNIAGKTGLTRTWDVHAERVVGCTDCHYALNNPAYTAEDADSNPDHLIFDPRKLDSGEYLQRPLHEFAMSGDDTAVYGTCESCHAVQPTHTWLPYVDRHTDNLACESCHVPRLEAAARQSADWTVLAPTGGPQTICRGVEQEDGTPLLTGYEPMLLPRTDADGQTRYAPYNLISEWYWVDGSGSPVALADLQAVYFTADGGYHPDVLAAFDADGDGALTSDEVIIDIDAKEVLIAGRLAEQGVTDPQIAGHVDAYAINHNVTHGEYALRDCRACHSDDSRLAAPMVLASDSPGGVSPTPGAGPLDAGTIHTSSDGTLTFATSAGQPGDETYIFGYSRSKIIDWIGILAFLGTLGGVSVHAGLRVLAARKRARDGRAHEPELQEVYMYTVYERLWHWLQTAAILLLIVTGLIIHKPDMFGMFSFAYVVQVHNVLAAIMVINAALALFYHVASGEIKQFLPEPKGFFGQAIEQAKFYTQGIFQGAEHPTEKTPERKMNPLQQVTYLGLLNVLLPLQVITGALMWGAQRWPEAAARVGGLPLLAPIHTLISWLLATFVVAHVYLTTTGHEPLASIKGMILGWDEVEVHDATEAHASAD